MTARAWGTTEQAESRLDPAGFEAVAGDLRERGKTWRHRSEWRRVVAEKISGPRPAAAPFDGVFAAAGIDADGNGSVIADPLGLRAVFFGSRGGRFAAGTSPGSVGDALSQDGRSPERDIEAVAHLAHNGLLPEGRSSYRDVFMLSPGARIVFAADRGPVVETAPVPPWEIDRDWSWPSSLPRVLDAIESEIGLAVTEIESAFGSPAFFDLTAGRDSRLLGAVAVKCRGAEGVHFRTYGASDQYDVEIAEQVSSHLGSPWSSGVFIAEVPTPQSERIRFEEFVGATEGTINAWKLTRPSGARLDEVRVSGLNGECLRAHRRVRRHLTGTADLLALRGGALKAGRLGLVREDARTTFDDGLTESLLAAGDRFEDSYDRLDWFDMRTRARGRYGLLACVTEQAHVARLLPLYSAQLISLAFGLGAETRRSEIIHRELIARVSEAAARVPLSGGPWLSGPQLPPPEADVGGGNHKPETFMAVVRDRSLDDRLEVIRDLASDGTNPIWDYIDRPAVLQATTDYRELPRASRVELFGAATAAEWARHS